MIKNNFKELFDNPLSNCFYCQSSRSVRCVFESNNIIPLLDTTLTWGCETRYTNKNPASLPVKNENEKIIIHASTTWWVECPVCLYSDAGWSYVSPMPLTELYKNEDPKLMGVLGYRNIT